jgi:glyoxylase-like metal-dependent hydrolase (beta-lactamase superfamily II)
LRHIEAYRLILEWILDIHPHADHFSAAGYLKDKTGAATGIGERVTEVQRLWKQIYNLPDTVPTERSQWDHLFADGEQFTVGEMGGTGIAVPWSYSQLCHLHHRERGLRSRHAFHARFGDSASRFSGR